MKPGLAFILIAVLLSLTLGLLIAGLPTSITLISIGTLFTLYLIFYHPVIAITALLCINPFDVFWLGGGITPIKIAYGASFLLLLISWLLKRLADSITGGKSSGIKSPVATPLAVFLSVAMLACLIGILRGHKFIGWSSDLNALIYYTLAFMLPDMVKDKKILHRIATLIIISTIIGILRFLLFIKAPDLHDVPDIAGGGGFVPFRTTSMLVLVALMASVAFAVSLGKGLWRMVFVFFSFILGAALLFSLARSFWMAALCGLVFLFFASSARQKNNFGKLAVIAAILFSIYTGISILLPQNNPLIRWGYSIDKRWESIFKAKDEPSIISRYSEQEAAKKQAFEHPFLGNGLGTQITYFRYDTWYGAQMWETTRFIHNVYLWTFLNMGIIGLISLLWLFFSLVRFGITVYRDSRDDKDKGLALGISGSFVTLLIVSLAGPLLTTPMLTIWIGFFIGCLVIIYRSREQATEEGQDE